MCIRDRCVAHNPEYPDRLLASSGGDDPWTLASVSYDGRVVLDQVPRAEKYRILL